MTKSKNHHSGSVDEPIRHYAITTAKILGAVLLLAVFVHVSWNMFAPEMFGLETIRMKQALGLVIFTGTFGLLLHFVTHRKRSVVTQ